MKSAAQKAAAGSMQAPMLCGSSRPPRLFGLTCSLLIAFATSALRTTIVTLTPFPASNTPIAVPKLPLPRIATLMVDARTCVPPRVTNESFFSIFPGVALSSSSSQDDASLNTGGPPRSLAMRAAGARGATRLYTPPPAAAGWPFKRSAHAESLSRSSSSIC
eukprot:scaffold41783_cov63-Phaeocystis_antarctica.AAC.1